MSDADTMGALATQDGYPSAPDPPPDWAMGALAAQQDYRPLGNDPWTNTMSARDAAQQAPPAPPPPSPVLYRTASPLANITQADIDRGMDLGMAFSGGGLGIKAYHGSPHDFEKFDLSRIGSGEGAQAYGHGLYFAENEGVARSYRNALATRAAVQNLDDTPLAMAAMAVKTTGESQARTNLLNNMKHFDETHPVHIKSAAALKAIDDGSYKNYPIDPGHMYEVNINADPAQLLDWDKPLSAQPQVYDKLSQLPQFQRQQAMVDSDRLVGLAKENGIPSLVAIKVQGQLAQGVPLSEAIAKVKGMSANPDWTAHTDRLQALVGDKQLTMQNILPAEWTGASIAQNVGSMRPAEIAYTLRNAGIPGIRYLDQGSRLLRNPADIEAEIAKANEQLAMWNKFPSDRVHPFMVKSLSDEIADLSHQLATAKAATSNYVMFNDQLIDILRKYGIAGAAPAGLGALAAQDQYQSQ